MRKYGMFTALALPWPCPGPALALARCDGARGSRFGWLAAADVLEASVDYAEM